MWSAFELVALAFALALDAAAIAAALAAARATPRELLTAVTAFAIAQAGMAGAGALGGVALAALASTWVHWVAGGLLLVVGGRMLWSRPDEEQTAITPKPLTLIVLALATSIDALAAGVTLPLLAPSPLVSVLVIGLVTGLLCTLAAIAGRHAGARLGVPAVRGAGVVLLALALRTLLAPMVG